MGPYGTIWDHTGPYGTIQLDTQNRNPHIQKHYLRHSAKIKEEIFIAKTTNVKIYIMINAWEEGVLGGGLLYQNIFLLEGLCSQYLSIPGNKLGTMQHIEILCSSQWHF